ncbi:MAG: sortase [Clostridia bacterium]|nr:sortase [Clostridia bacterium]
MKSNYICIKLSKLKACCLFFVFFFIFVCIAIYNESHMVKFDINKEIRNVIAIKENLESGNNEEENQKIINGFPALGKIIIPKINLNTYIFDATNEKTLKEGVTKFYGGNINTQGNFCIAGHNYFGDKMFGDLHKVAIGDKFLIEDNYGRNLEYVIYDISKVSPKDVSCLKQEEEGSTQVTLITCTTAAIKRLIVKAKVIYD